MLQWITMPFFVFGVNEGSRYQQLERLLETMLDGVSNPLSGFGISAARGFFSSSSIARSSRVFFGKAR
jgi:hypothetical protein